MTPPLKLLLVSYTLPQLGGLETMTRLISRELSRQGRIETRIVTPSSGEWDPQLASVTVHRQPDMAELNSHYQWADVVFFNHAYLRLALPLLWMPHKPFVLSMSGYTPPSQVNRWRDRLTGWMVVWLLHRANAVVACNKWCQNLMPVPSTVVRNPYDNEKFVISQEGHARPGDLLFAGRITHSKGCEELVEAYAALRTHFTDEEMPKLTFVGDGQLRVSVENRLAELGLTRHVTFTGALSGEGVVEELRRHKVLVVPSRYEEPVGIVGLEGIACGCVVVGSSGGGLSETIGPFGFTFPNGNVEELTLALRKALALTEADRLKLMENREDHLHRYRAAEVVQGYLRVVASVLPHSLKPLLVDR